MKTKAGSVTSAPQKLLSLLQIAESSELGLKAVHIVLSAVASDAYLDVKSPYGPRGLEQWMNRLVEPDVWLKHPSWINAIEGRLADLAKPKNSQVWVASQSN